MQVSSNMGAVSPALNVSNVKTVFTEKLTKEEVGDLKKQIMDNANAFTFNSTTAQMGAANKKDDFAQNYQDFQSFLGDIGYKGKPIAELSKDEAAALVSEDGIFGVKQTSERIANFVISGSGGDEERMRAGREGMIQGFKDAEKAWGDKLPDISQQTMKKAIEMVDKAMSDLGFSILDKEA
ncbi:MAG: hypothetical protein WC656_11300 [Sulfurimonas sp.]|jgi:hypothetical protein